ncbi:MAG: hypothetical protein ACQETE_02930 [Bacteroidota bacterium]
MSKPPILLFQPYYDRPGHFQRFTDTIHRELKKQNRTVYLMHGRRSGGSAEDPEVRSYTYFSTRKLIQVGMSTWGLRKVKQWIKQMDKAPVLYLLDVEFVTLATYLQRFPHLLEQVPKLVIHVHNLPKSVSETEKGLRGIRQRRMQPALEDLSEQENVQFITNGQQISDQLESYGVSGEQILSSRWGSYLPIVASNRPTSIPPTFLILGIWRKEKNIPLVLEALAKVKTPCTLTIAGYPRDFSRSDLEAQIEQLPVEQHEIRILDRYLNEATYTRLLDEHQFLLLPYATHHQSSSGPLIDGLMRRCIPLISDGGERVRIVRSHQVGRIMPQPSAATIAEQISWCVAPHNEEQVRTYLRQIESVNSQYQWSKIVEDWIRQEIFD